jgi:tetratricopeptide (TPR) repeat protein
MKPTLGRRIREARRALGLTQEALGRPNFTKGFISLLENDRAKPSVASLERLAARLERPLSYFLDGGDAPASFNPVDVLRSRGRAELASGAFGPALATFEELRRIASSQRDIPAELQAALGAGEALLGLNRIDEARAQLQNARDSARRTGASSIECRALHRLAEIELRDGRDGEAASLSRASLDAARALGPAEALLLGEIHLQLGAALSRMGQLDAAAAAYGEARAIFDLAAEPERAGGALFEAAAARINDGDHRGAVVQFDRARTLFEQSQISRAMSRLSDQAGALLMQMGRHAEAAEHFTASLVLKERFRDVRGECRVLTELARCLHAAGQPARAKALAERAAARSREAELPDEEARAQALLGTLAAAAGDLREAQRALASAARYCEDAGMTLELVPIYKELARLAGLAGRYKDASGYHERAFRLLQNLRPAEIAAAMQSAESPAAAGTPLEPRSDDPQDS